MTTVASTCSTFFHTLYFVLLLFILIFTRITPPVQSLSIVIVQNETSNDFGVSTPESVVLYPNEFLERGEFRASPGKKFRAGLSATGDFVLQDLQINPDKSPLLIWSAGTTGGTSLIMQTDGNLIVRDANRQGVWSTKTQNNPTARLFIDDSGQIALKDGSNRLWLGGLPRDYYNHSKPTDLEFPIRGTFYYPWYPDTFTVNGHWSHYKPSMGWYSSSNPDVVRYHIDSLDYAHFGLSVASWWGPDTHLDRARLTMLLDTTIAKNSTLKWTIYYEKEMKSNPSVYEIQNDLSYLMRWFARHPAWAYKDGKPVIFVYNENSNCELVQRWKQASRDEWYLVMKVFSNHKECALQPDSFHQYGSGDDGVVRNRGYSFVISPGFWHASQKTARVPRSSPRKFCLNVKEMTRSREPWQLVVSFNEAGEGTMIESSREWQSRSGYGQYLDCLHDVPMSASIHSIPFITISLSSVVLSFMTK
ncbi:glycosyl hydrolase family 99 protein [Nitzschia inconspicua]|uniref:Glycosyl hydrolase family 99 protein n=1 Tax=Nitzschia inconspicua TaxID=303405 RepID=A0A9K3LWD7_9STRA|nr:glycosyl hydrolase family 99 protein [Nitzschia inconspicua]